MNAQPFDLATCPRVRARQARATRTALRGCALLPARWSVDVPPLGSATMAFAGFDGDAERADGVELTVSFGVARGRVSVDAALVTRIVDLVLGGQAALSPVRTVGPAERGLLAGILAPVFDRIGGSVLPGPLAVRDGRSAEAATLAFSLETAVAVGWLRLTPPAAGLGAVGDGGEIWRARAGRLPVTAGIELATTRIPAGALAGAGAGDAVVFDGARASMFARDATWTGRLRVGDHAAGVAVDGAGTVSITGGFSPLQHEEGNMSASGSNTDATTVLAAASIEVVAELGRIALRGDELLGLAPGAVLALGASRSRVTLRVGGEAWADGEIVDVDGELGVRITRVVNR
jgi:flagellar motor switch/type III secretory pathway protein FliN